MSVHDEGAAAEPLDWFGNPLREPDAPRDPVPCPRCGAGFTEAAAMRAHLGEAHGVRSARATEVGGRASRWSRFRDFLDSLRFLPPWFVIPLNLGFSVALWLALGRPAELVSLDRPDRVLATWAVRLSLLPVTVYLAARVVGLGRR